jgi:hypothetical protein
MIFWVLRAPGNFRRCEVHAALSYIRARIIIFIHVSLDAGIEICLLRAAIFILLGKACRWES